MPTPAKDYADVLSRLLRNTKIVTSGCWEWAGATGYLAITLVASEMTVEESDK